MAWVAGAQTRLHLHTQNSQTKAFLEIQLGVPADPRRGAAGVRGEEPGPSNGQQHNDRPQQWQPRQRGSAARARDTVNSLACAAAEESGSPCC